MIIYLQMIETEEDQSKFEIIYRKYRFLMYKIAYDIVHNKYDAEDAVHLAFVKLAENMEKIEEPICPKTKTLVSIIAKHRAIDIYRHHEKHPTISLEEAYWLTVEYDGSNCVTECMTRLPDAYRDVLLLKYYHGYTTEEIAGFLGLSSANVSKIHQRAKNKLEVLCREEGLL